MQVVTDAAVLLAQQTSVDLGGDAVASGYLFKRGGGTSTKYSRRAWTKRFVIIRDRTLYYYDVNKGSTVDIDSAPRGSLSLSNAHAASSFRETVASEPSRSSLNFCTSAPVSCKFTFQVRDLESGEMFEFLAQSAAERDKWLDWIGDAISMPPRLTYIEPENESKADRRYAHFVGQRAFVRGLVDLAEQLRFAPVDGEFCRQSRLQPGLDRLPASPSTYYPLGVSSDHLHRVLRFSDDESIVFNTKARCPLLLVIETQELPLTAASCCDVDAQMIGSTNENAENFFGSLCEKMSNKTKPKVEAQGTEDETHGIIGDKPPELSIAEKKKELWEAKAERIGSTSDLRKLPGWTLKSLIVKSNDDVRQEVFVMQLITFLASVFPSDLTWVKPYHILATGPNSGLLETIVSAQDIDRLKKAEGYTSLLDLYVERYGPPESEGFRKAQNNFCRSLAGYSVIMYLLLLRDRHNGNLMIDGDGYFFHIDFGFCLGHSTGKQIGGWVESSPFKLTREYVNLLGGPKSPVYQQYCKGCVEAMVAARANADIICTMVEISGTKSNFPCFKQTHVTKVVQALRKRLYADKSEEVLRRDFPKKIEVAREHKGTYYYDYFQKKQQGYAM